MPRTSSLEVAVAAELKQRGEPFEVQRRFHWYVVDFYLPERNLVIEADGAYWHSLPNVQRTDKAKNGYMRSHGINLARLTEEAIRADVRAAVDAALRLHPRDGRAMESRP
jgi:very-short-patch-repair endonuclease